MTSARTYHIVAISLIVLGLIVGGVCWALDGTMFWVMTGVSVVLIIAGLTFASRAAGVEQRGRREDQ